MKAYKRIRNYIKENGIMITFVSARSGISRARLYTLLNGTTRLTVDDYETICIRGLNVHPQYFFDNKFLDFENDVLSSQLYGRSTCLDNGK